MSPEEIKIADDLQDMFMSDGWKFYMEQIANTEKTLVQIAPDNAITNDQWQYARGQINQLRQTLGFENYINVSRAQAEFEANEVFEFPEDEVDVDLI